MTCVNCLGDITGISYNRSLQARRLLRPQRRFYRQGPSRLSTVIASWACRTYEPIGPLDPRYGY